MGTSTNAQITLIQPENPGCGPILDFKLNWNPGFLRKTGRNRCNFLQPPA